NPPYRPGLRVAPRRRTLFKASLHGGVIERQGRAGDQTPCECANDHLPDLGVRQTAFPGPSMSMGMRCSGTLRKEDAMKRRTALESRLPVVLTVVALLILVGMSPLYATSATGSQNPDVGVSVSLTPDTALVGTTVTETYSLTNNTTALL